MKNVSALFGSLVAATLMAETAAADLYQSFAVPPFEVIAKNASSMRKCKPPLNFVGVHDRKDNTFTVYYRYRDPNGSVFYTSSMTLVRLTNGIWEISCGNPMDGYTSQLLSL
ncbi:hypothetical protein [Vannielia litorea]|uniref:Uncharacterized protein n=1 Tax=Vannielia litorea TaxID=1217970 RepID=A0A1N6FJ85_9RHOB|nr:hypothetical protein [Vannielia litorea]SIN95304.1 hypothetical protein SAMN05444002_1712 [Vannielia litorea]